MEWYLGTIKIGTSIFCQTLKLPLKHLLNTTDHLKLVWDCHHSLTQLARRNRFQLIRVLGHEATVGNETADQLVRTGSEHPFTGREPARGISIAVVKKVVSGWTNRNHRKYWTSTAGLKQAKGLISGPSARETKDLLKLNRDQLRLLKGHCHLKGYLFKLGLTDDPICERCLEEDQSATHPVWYEAHVRVRHLGLFFMEPSDYYDAPVYQVLHFIRGVGLIKG
jgi:hypothetical protein